MYSQFPMVCAFKMFVYLLGKIRAQTFHNEVSFTWVFPVSTAILEVTILSFVDNSFVLV